MEDQDNITRTRTCCNTGCKNTLTYTNGQPIDQEFADKLASWLMVTSENVTPEGLVVNCKTYCSVQCLGEYITSIVLEYNKSQKPLIELVH